MDVVIVGASLGGVRVVEALRSAGHSDRIVLIGDERHAPYDRPPLSKEVLTGKLGLDDIALRPDLDDLDVDLVLGRRAVGLDPARRTVRLDGGELVTYDELVVATGARARVPPAFAGVPGVVTLRTIEDAEAIRDAMDTAAEVAVVGGGFIGSEVASAARDRGLSTTVFEALPAPMCRVFCPSLAARFAALHADNGSRLRCGLAIEGVVGRSHVEALRVSDGTTVAADLVVVGVGSVPNVEWLGGAGLDVSDGVLCDRRGRAVGADAVHAVGDVARWPSARFGDAVRTEHWTAAGDQAYVVAADLLDQPLPAEALPYVWSDQFGHRIQLLGRCSPDDDVLLVADDGDRFVAITGRHGQLRSVIAMDEPKRFGAFRRLLLRDASWDDAVVAAAK